MQDYLVLRVVTIPLGGTKNTSEIPCRVSSDLHERCNDFVTVLRGDSANLKWL